MIADGEWFGAVTHCSSDMPAMRSMSSGAKKAEQKFLCEFFKKIHQKIVVIYFTIM
jgi:hypothetical protein